MVLQLVIACHRGAKGGYFQNSKHFSSHRPSIGKILTLDMTGSFVTSYPSVFCFLFYYSLQKLLSKSCQSNCRKKTKERNIMKALESASTETTALLRKNESPSDANLFTGKPTTISVLRQAQLIIFLLLLLVLSLSVIIMLERPTDGDEEGGVSSPVLHQSMPQMGRRPHQLLRASMSKSRLEEEQPSIIASLPKDCPSSASLKSVILLVRHCEDGSTVRQSDLSRHCNPLGFARAKYLATLFGGESSCRWPLPSHLYGLSKGKNMRQYETLVPLASNIGTVPIQMIDYSHSIETLVEKHVQDLVEFCHTTSPTSSTNGFPIMVTVVSWKHAYIPSLARALGCDHCPSEWSDDDFDSVWELNFYHSKDNDDGSNTNDDDDHKYWHVYGSLTQQNFDPLSFHYEDYKQEKREEQVL